MKKNFQITADLFDNKYLTALMDFMAFISPAKTKNEKAIRERDRKAVVSGNSGSPVVKKKANLGGKLDRDRILSGTTIFGSVPEVTEKDIRLISEAGFDFIINGNQGDYSRKILDWCEKYNIAVIGDECREFLSKDFRSIDYDNMNIFDGFCPHSASVGDTCWDEPNTKDFGVVSAFHRAYKSVFPDRFIFSNLLPGCAFKSALGASTYTDYVSRFSSQVDSDYISVDIYPFHPSGIINKVEMSFCLHTYHTLGNICRRDGKDFWLYIQSQMRWFSHLYTMTTFEMIKWQVYASLCYGCRSIIHASYNPVWGGDAIGIIDYDGNLTEQYLYVKKVNAELAKLSPVLKDYRSLGVAFTDSKKLNHHFVFAVGRQKKNNRLQNFSGISEVKSLKSEYTALTGYFKNPEGKKALLIVNCRNVYDPSASQRITVSFDGNRKINIYEHGELTSSLAAEKVEINPGSCDGVFITIE